DPVLPDRRPEETMATIPWALHNNLPDLVVTDVYGVPSDPRPGEQVHVTVGIKNIGGGPTHGSILVDVDVDGHYVGSASQDGSLPPGGAIELEILRAGPRNYWTATPGAHTLTATVNSRRAVEEANYSAASNSLSRTIRVPVGP
ncbi:MAG TPA: CARDB domain-containing protein, partial [Armatimonadota bacterium]|nr:CARDB domain-containing protein [Armatimonadota bacterium]